MQNFLVFLYYVKLWTTDISNSNFLPKIINIKQQTFIRQTNKQSNKKKRINKNTHKKQNKKTPKYDIEDMNKSPKWPAVQ